MPIDVVSKFAHGAITSFRLFAQSFQNDDI
jgi:hypothetical protein